MKRQAVTSILLFLFILSTPVIAQRNTIVTTGILTGSTNFRGYDLSISHRLSKTLPISIEGRYSRQEHLHIHKIAGIGINYHFKLTHKLDSSNTRGLFIEPTVGYMYSKVNYRQYTISYGYIRDPNIPIHIPAGTTSFHILNTAIKVKYLWSIKTRVILSPWASINYRLMTGRYILHSNGVGSVIYNPFSGAQLMAGFNIGYAF